MKMSQEELKKIVSKHAEWIKAGSPGADLYGAKLTDADLRY